MTHEPGKAHAAQSIHRPEQGVGAEVAQWWRTDIIDMAPGEIRYRGYPVEQLIGNVSFAQMVWLMVMGALPTPAQARLLDAALMAAVDHGPQAPSIAIARMAATCGVGLNNAMASAVNVLGDVHGGAGEQAVMLYQAIASQLSGDENTASNAQASVVCTDEELRQATELELERFMADYGRFIPGFGHRFHPIDPRAPRLLALVDDAAQEGEVSGDYARIARMVEAVLAQRKSKAIPLNIDGATAVIYAELGVPAPLARGLFCLSRSVGILAHSWEQTEQGGRNKGPIPRQFLWQYDGPSPRDLV